LYNIDSIYENIDKYYLYYADNRDLFKEFWDENYKNFVINIHELKLKIEIHSKHRPFLKQKVDKLHDNVSIFYNYSTIKDKLIMIKNLQEQYKKKYINNLKFKEPKSNKFLEHHSMKEE
jgi:hypothetical protein